MIKLSDYVVQFIADQGVKHVFMVPGGGAMHLVDSLGRSPNLQFVANHHEQASAIAAEAYGKLTNNLGVAIVTAGPGATNAITGVVGAWQDSTPCLFVSGQVKTSDLMTGRGVRVMGVQEVDIVTLVSSISKYAVTIREPDSIRYHLEKAAFLARSGRPGPVWIDIPLDVQAAMIAPESQQGFTPPAGAKAGSEPISEQVGRAIALLNEADRPVILAGNGIRLAKAESEFEQFVRLANVPVLSTWLASGLIGHDHDLFFGSPGATAPRGANFVVQNSDYLLTIGARLDLVVTGFSHVNFARSAKKVMVDVDEAELRKMQTRIDLPICCDAKAVLTEFLRQRDKITPRRDAAWMARCRDWKARYPIVLPEHRSLKGSVSTYVLADIMSEQLTDQDTLVIASSGIVSEIFFLALRVKRNQRVLNTTALGPMGFCLPSSIAGALASPGGRTVAIEGDGGFQLNIQELETLARLRLPIKYFVLNNHGYASIRAMQQSRFGGHLVACDDSSGLTFPSLDRIAAAYGLPFTRIIDQTNLDDQIQRVINTPGTILCEVMSPPNEARQPGIAATQRPDGTLVSSPLEELSPPLGREEFLSNMIVPPVEGSSYLRS